ncbi:MAG TPA: hypothetical protein VL088_04870 [Pedobacter sp.]|nr:hypothetical protein [Pedobacter sp.]
MKLYQYLTISTVALFAACQSKQNKAIDNPPPPATKQFCYAYFKNNDTATLTLITSGHIITGELSYNLFEKDGNSGIIKGEMRGDTIVADYLFESEGKQSTRQVVFLKKDGKLLEGYGDISEKQGKTTFNSIAELKFGEGIEFSEVNCQ